MKTRIARSLTALAAAVLLASCGGGGDGGDGPIVIGDTVVVTSTGRVFSFNRGTPGSIVRSETIKGLNAGDTIAGIDYRPTDTQIYLLTTRGLLYALNAGNGDTNLLRALRPAAGDPFVSLVGSDFGVDFNPVPDRLRVVSNTGQNLRINVDTGEVITDAPINGGAGAPQVSGSAYTNSFPGAATTQLYALDAANGRLYLQDPPNAGTLNGGVTLGVTGSNVNGFDIERSTRIGYAALTPTGGATTLYRVSLDAAATAATPVGLIGESGSIVGLTLLPI